MDVESAARRVKQIQPTLARLPLVRRNALLEVIGEELWQQRDSLYTANQADLRLVDPSNPLLGRLRFDQAKLLSLREGLRALMSLPDPLGKVRRSTLLDEGLILTQLTVPIGVVGVIFESRPDVLVQVSSLCLKSGNGVILKGGREARCTNRALADVLKEAIAKTNFSPHCLALLESRADIARLIKLNSHVDLIIPRGSSDLVRSITQSSTIPVLGHADGVCHLYLDKEASEPMSVALAVDSKVQNVAVCNAIETLLVHEERAKTLLPLLQEAFERTGILLRGCDRTRTYLPIEAATEEDWCTEYLDAILSIRTVNNMEEAIAHITTYGSRHTDGIVTASRQRAERFLAEVDSGSVFWNCSSRFADGFRYGLGAEVGISTGKIHARGPVGLEGLVTYKWQLRGQGQIVADYVGRGAKPFLHRSLPSHPSSGTSLSP